MKQGTGNKSSAPKGPHRTNAVSLDSVARLGAHVANIKGLSPMVKASKVHAPVSTQKGHPTGSQGKHK